MPSIGDISFDGEILDINVFQATEINYISNKDGFETQYKTSNNEFKILLKIQLLLSTNELI